MSEPLEIHEHLAAPTASRVRGKSRISLIVLHYDPRPASLTLAAYTAPGARYAPHYLLDAHGAATRLVPDRRAARHSGSALWNGRRRTVDLISIGVTLEGTPGAPPTDPQLLALHALLAKLRRAHKLGEDDIRRWEQKDETAPFGEGLLLPVTLPPIPLYEAPAPGLLTLGDDGAPIDDDVICIPPPPPPDPTEGGGLVLGAEDDPATAALLWGLLAQESYRHRGEGFRSDWSFHTFATQNGMGAPLAKSAGSADQVTFGGKRYGFQPFAGDTLFNEIPRWADVQSLNNTLNGTIPPSGLARQLLEASYRATGNVLHADWSFHQLAVREQLGPPISGNYRIVVGGQAIAMQVFARDTLYTLLAQPENKTAWDDVRRLSDLHAAPSELRDALWAETYKPCGAAYQPDSAFQQLAMREKLGAPLTGLYQVDLQSTRYNVQVFAADTLYSPADDPRRLSALPRPADTKAIAPQPVLPVQGGQSPADPADTKRTPVFTMLPVPTDARPRMSQFFGFTKFAKTKGAQFYTQTQGRHSGLDIFVPVGTRLVAIDYGVVFCAGRPKAECPWGGAPPIVIVVRYGNVYAVYGHCSAAHVSKGQPVRPGDIIGLSGEFPAATPHLHFEIRPVANPAQAFNPVPFFTGELQSSYFAPQLGNLGGLGHFCCGSFSDQPTIDFGRPIDTRPCER